MKKIILMIFAFLIILHSSYAVPANNESLIVYLTFDENETWSNSTSYPQEGGIRDTPTFNAGSDMVGSGFLDFDAGGYDSITINNAGTDAMVNFTLCVWETSTNSNAFEILFGKYDGDYDGDWRVYDDDRAASGTNNWRMQMFDGDDDYIQSGYISDAITEGGHKNLICFQVNQTTARFDMYLIINYTVRLQAGDAQAGYSTCDDNLTIGVVESSATEAWNGYLDEVMLFNYAMTTDEIYHLWSNGTAGNTLNYTTAEAPPPPVLPSLYVNIDYPAEGEHINKEFWLNGTAYSENPISNITINWTEYEMRWNYTAATDTCVYFNFSGWSADGQYFLNVTVNDTSGNENSSVRNFTIDTGLPVITISNPLNNTFYSYPMPYEITCTDPYPYRLNFSVYLGTVQYFSRVNATSQQTSLSINGSLTTTPPIFPDGQYNISVFCSDSHTTSLIKEYDVDVNDFYKTIKFNDDITIKLIASTIGLPDEKIYYEKLSDRYIVNFGSDVKHGTYTFDVVSKNSMDYLPKSVFKAHFVTGKYWIDFNNKDKDAIYFVEKIADNAYRVSITTDSLDFSSVGELNIAYKFLNVTIDNSYPNVSAILPLNNSYYNTTAVNFSAFAFDIPLFGNLSNVSLLLNGSIVRTNNVTLHASIENFSINLNNSNYYFQFQACDMAGNCNISSQNYTIRVNVTLMEEYFSYTECKSSSGAVMMMVLFVAIAFILVYFGLKFGIGFIGFFGSVLLMIISWYIIPCVTLYGYVMALLSIVCMVYFVLTGLGFNNTTFR